MSRLNAVFKNCPNAVFMSRLNAVFMSPQRELGGASVARAPPNSRWGLLDIYVGGSWKYALGAHEYIRLTHEYMC